MPRIVLETLIEAPVERVFDLARSIDAHVASTEGTGERAVGGRTSGLIEMGETVTWEARHFGVVQRFRVKITAFERPEMFVDEMLSGAFAMMRHRHVFSSLDGVTLMRDEFDFSAPCGLAGRLAERAFLTRYMERFLAKRAAALKQMAESDRWRGFGLTGAGRG
jgi:ligand-binding SRPBCC domain-containing protein